MIPDPKTYGIKECTVVVMPLHPNDLEKHVRQYTKYISQTGLHGERLTLSTNHRSRKRSKSNYDDNAGSYQRSFKKLKCVQYNGSAKLEEYIPHTDLQEEHFTSSTNRRSGIKRSKSDYDNNQKITGSSQRNFKKLKSVQYNERPKLEENIHQRSAQKKLKRLKIKYSDMAKLEERIFNDYFCPFISITEIKQFCNSKNERVAKYFYVLDFIFRHLRKTGNLLSLWDLRVNYLIIKRSIEEFTDNLNALYTDNLKALFDEHHPNIIQQQAASIIEGDNKNLLETYKNLLEAFCTSTITSSSSSCEILQSERTNIPQNGDNHVSKTAEQTIDAGNKKPLSNMINTNHSTANELRKISDKYGTSKQDDFKIRNKKETSYQKLDEQIKNEKFANGETKHPCTTAFDSSPPSNIANSPFSRLLSTQEVHQTEDGKENSVHEETNATPNDSLRDSLLTKRRETINQSSKSGNQKIEAKNGSSTNDKNEECETKKIKSPDVKLNRFLKNKNEIIDSENKEPKNITNNKIIEMYHDRNVLLMTSKEGEFDISKEISYKLPESVGQTTNLVKKSTNVQDNDLLLVNKQESSSASRKSAKTENGKENSVHDETNATPNDSLRDSLLTKMRETINQSSKSGNQKIEAKNGSSTNDKNEECETKKIKSPDVKLNRFLKNKNEIIDSENKEPKNITNNKIIEMYDDRNVLLMTSKDREFDISKEISYKLPESVGQTTNLVNKSTNVQDNYLLLANKQESSSASRKSAKTKSPTNLESIVEKQKKKPNENQKPSNNILSSNMKLGQNQSKKDSKDDKISSETVLSSINPPEVSGKILKAGESTTNLENNSTDGQCNDMFTKQIAGRINQSCWVVLERLEYLEMNHKPTDATTNILLTGNNITFNSEGGGNLTITESNAIKVSKLPQQATLSDKNESLNGKSNVAISQTKRILRSSSNLAYDKTEISAIQKTDSEDRKKIVKILSKVCNDESYAENSDSSAALGSCEIQGIRMLNSEEQRTAVEDKEVAVQGSKHDFVATNEILNSSTAIKLNQTGGNVTITDLNADQVHKITQQNTHSDKNESLCGKSNITLFPLKRSLRSSSNLQSEQNEISNNQMTESEELKKVRKGPYRSKDCKDLSYAEKTAVENKEVAHPEGKHDFVATNEILNFSTAIKLNQTGGNVTITELNADQVHKITQQNTHSDKNRSFCGKSNMTISPLKRSLRSSSNLESEQTEISNNQMTESKELKKVRKGTYQSKDCKDFSYIEKTAVEDKELAHQEGKEESVATNEMPDSSTAIKLNQNIENVTITELNAEKVHKITQQSTHSDKNESLCGKSNITILPMKRSLRSSSNLQSEQNENSNNQMTESQEMKKFRKAPYHKDCNEFSYAAKIEVEDKELALQESKDNFVLTTEIPDSSTAIKLNRSAGYLTITELNADQVHKITQENTHIDKNESLCGKSNITVPPIKRSLRSSSNLQSEQNEISNNQMTESEELKKVRKGPYRSKDCKDISYAEKTTVEDKELALQESKDDSVATNEMPDPLTAIKVNQSGGNVTITEINAEKVLKITQQNTHGDKNESLCGKSNITISPIKRSLRSSSNLQCEQNKISDNQMAESKDVKKVRKGPYQSEDCKDFSYAEKTTVEDKKLALQEGKDDSVATNEMPDSFTAIKVNQSGGNVTITELSAEKILKIMQQNTHSDENESLCEKSNITISPIKRSLRSSSNLQSEQNKISDNQMAESKDLKKVRKGPYQSEDCKDFLYAEKTTVEDKKLALQEGKDDSVATNEMPDSFTAIKVNQSGGNVTITELSVEKVHKITQQNTHSDENESLCEKSNITISPIKRSLRSSSNLQSEQNKINDNQMAESEDLKNVRKGPYRSEDCEDLSFAEKTTVEDKLSLQEGKDDSVATNEMPDSLTAIKVNQSGGNVTITELNAEKVLKITQQNTHSDKNESLSGKSNIAMSPTEIILRSSSNLQSDQNKIGDIQKTESEDQKKIKISCRTEVCKDVSFAENPDSLTALGNSENESIRMLISEEQRTEVEDKEVVVQESKDNFVFVATNEMVDSSNAIKLNQSGEDVVITELNAEKVHEITQQNTHGDKNESLSEKSIITISPIKSILLSSSNLQSVQNEISNQITESEDQKKVRKRPYGSKDCKDFSYAEKTVFEDSKSAVQKSKDIFVETDKMPVNSKTFQFSIEQLIQKPEFGEALQKQKNFNAENEKVPNTTAFSPAKIISVSPSDLNQSENKSVEDQMAESEGQEIISEEKFKLVKQKGSTEDSMFAENVTNDVFYRKRNRLSVKNKKNNKNQFSKLAEKKKFSNTSKKTMHAVNSSRKSNRSNCVKDGSVISSDILLCSFELESMLSILLASPYANNNDD